MPKIKQVLGEVVAIQSCVQAEHLVALQPGWPSFVVATPAPSPRSCPGSSNGAQVIKAAGAAGKAPPSGWVTGQPLIANVVLRAKPRKTNIAKVVYNSPRMHRYKYKIQRIKNHQSYNKLDIWAVWRLLSLPPQLQQHGGGGDDVLKQAGPGEHNILLLPHF